MHILIAPNAFKNSLDAGKAASAIASGLEESKLTCTYTLFPVGDGGDGTGSLLTGHLGGEQISSPTHDVMGNAITGSIGMVANKKLAIIEMANASGLGIIDRQKIKSLSANSFGTGEQIVQALQYKVEEIIITLGGSATTDGGSGILKALGVKFLDKEGKILQQLPGDLQRLEFLDIAGLHKRISACRVHVLCDVENKLLGEAGARMFAKQKGATPKEIDLLEQGLKKLTTAIKKLNGKNAAVVAKGGAAGGTAAGLYGVLGARLVNGIRYFLEITGFEKELKKADLVITAEGSIDEQTLQGKGPFGVAEAAAQLGIPVVGLAGLLPDPLPAALKKCFTDLICINPHGSPIAEAMSKTGENLHAAALAFGNRLASTAS